MSTIELNQILSFEDFKIETIKDYKLACLSREVSLIGRKEVLTGKAKFGIFGDGKEVAQLAMAKVFQAGDFRSGYYRDQTFMFASGMTTIEEFFHQLYALPDVELEPSSGGRQMNAHFATRSLDEHGMWKDLKNLKNSASDTSPTASQVLRAVGLGLASKIYRNQDALANTQFSHDGNEVTFVTIGDASTSEGIFWESINAAGVLKIPIAVFIWDDGYGISVPQKYQTTKENISEILVGFQVDDFGNGIRIYSVNGWDYSGLIQTFKEGIEICRREHLPVIFHVKQMTQPQGHSTSGSHERYKSAQRLSWEEENDCILKMRNWMIENSISTEDFIQKIEEEAKLEAKETQKKAWNNHLLSIKTDMSVAFSLLENFAQSFTKPELIENLIRKLKNKIDPIRRDIMSVLKESIVISAGFNSREKQLLIDWTINYDQINNERYNSNLHSTSSLNVNNIPQIKPIYLENGISVNGYEILNKCFDAHFSSNPFLVAFGEDLGKIGDVNQGFSGLQEKYSEQRIFDTGIREASIIGQGIGLAMRGLRPIAEIQYLDYLLYGLQPLSDDLATLQYRTKGGQKAPLIIRTRGHRLEGIWHTGSPMGMIINSLRGIHVCVPRNMVQAAGFYNLLLKSDEPGLVVECLNGYRLKEELPENISEFTIPFGVPEILNQGDDITIVSYGSTLRIIQEAIIRLESVGISVELIDVQTLLPFDTNGIINDSIKKTNRVLFVDEDVPGGTTAYMLQQVFEDESLFKYLDAFPKCLSAKPNRVAYGSDGDYFGKPNVEDVYINIYRMLSEVSPKLYPPMDL